MFSIERINSLTRGPFPTSVFLFYLATSLVCFAVYTFSFIKVFRDDSPRTKCCCDPLRFGAKTLIVLGMPFLANGFRLIDAIIGTASYYLGENLQCHFIFEIFLGVVVVLNLTTVNYF